MTSGRFHRIEISSIVVDRDARQRKQIKDAHVKNLAYSIGKRGLIHPVVISNERVLVTGECRLAACKELGWTHINAQYTDELSPHDLRAIELEENVKRLDLTWEEQSLAVLEYHEHRTADEPTWSQAKTAEAIGLSAESVSGYVRVAKALRQGDPQVTEAPMLSTALGIVNRRERRQEALDVENFERIERPEVPVGADSILTTSFLDWAPQYSGPRFNFIHMDFPYGIDADKHVQGAADTHGGYSDTFDTYHNLLHCLCSNILRLSQESSHLMFWFSMQHYQFTFDYLSSNSPFIIDPIPLVWLKSDNSGIIPDPQRGPRRIYETAFFGSRGDRPVVRCKSNAYAAPSVRDIHMSIKPEPMLRHFFEMFVDETTSLLDPTCGSGSSLRAAESLGARFVQGLEINESFAEGARLELAKFRRLRRAS